MHAIELQQLSKSFAQQQVLSGLDLQVPEHSVFAFLGNNGQGKSTTIRLITGLLTPDQGSIHICGIDLARQPRQALALMGCLIDSPSLYPNLSAAEFLQIGCLAKGLPFREIDRVLGIVALSGVRNKLIATFSLGMRQRIALAHALLGEPKLLVLDEPSNGLDPAGIQEMRELLSQLPQRSNCTVFFSSHQLDEAERIASHFALLAHGRICAQTSAAAWRAEQNGELELEISAAEHAAILLRGLGYEAQVRSAKQLAVRGIEPMQASHVHASIVHAGIELFSSSFRRPSLEQWFAQAGRQQAAFSQ